MKAIAIGATAALLLLAGCGGKNEADGVSTTVTDDATGKSATVRFGGTEDGIAPPANLPAFAAIYPGATIQSAISGNEGEAKGMVTMMTSAKPADVLAFYREKGSAAGLSVKAEAAMGTGRMLAMGAKDGDDTALNITVTPAGDAEGQTVVAVVYDGGKPG
jgi:ABC-type glycerol-3-phosphate transport system substrate-binding protein